MEIKIMDPVDRSKLAMTPFNIKNSTSKKSEKNTIEITQTSYEKYRAKNKSLILKNFNMIN